MGAAHVLKRNQAGLLTGRREKGTNIACDLMEQPTTGSNERGAHPGRGI